MEAIEKRRGSEKRKGKRETGRRSEEVESDFWGSWGAHQEAGVGHARGSDALVVRGERGAGGGGGHHGGSLEHGQITRGASVRDNIIGCYS